MIEALLILLLLTAIGCLTVLYFAIIWGFIKFIWKYSMPIFFIVVIITIVLVIA
tara:strand:+ start:192 stop:353 length:162 start_codon:yes stop_codon:yes gene_type:complete